MKGEAKRRRAYKRERKRVTKGGRNAMRRVMMNGERKQTNGLKREERKSGREGTKTI